MIKNHFYEKQGNLDFTLAKGIFLDPLNKEINTIFSKTFEEKYFQA